MRVAPGYVLVDADGIIWPEGCDVEMERELIDITDPFGFFGPPDTYEKFAPGITTIRINGTVVPGPVELRLA